MSEYQEAISRLNIPERTPGTMISRASFFLPRKDTPENFNRILRETLNTPLPKYSIPQRLFIKADKNIEYNFPLEKQFCLAPGGRKSIAIREVNLDQVNLELTTINAQGQSVNINDEFLVSITGDYYIVDLNDPTGVNFNVVNINLVDQQLSVSRNQSYKPYMKDIADYITNQLNQHINANRDANSPHAGVNPCSVIDDDNIVIHIADDAEFEASKLQVSIRLNPANQNWISCFGLLDNQIRRSRFEYKRNQPWARIILETRDNFFAPMSVCSTVNPWSPGNIIGSRNQLFQNLNKLFPYDNSQQIKIWFSNFQGYRVQNAILEGYIDLELIIDNLNNFAMED